MENKTKIVVRVFGPRSFNEGVSFEHENTELEDIYPIVKDNQIWYICKYKTIKPNNT